MLWPLRALSLFRSETQMKKYVVEVQREEAWSEAEKIEPAYDLEIRHSRLPWRRPTYVIPNLEEAEEEALEQAIGMAKGAARVGAVKITEVTTVAGRKDKQIVWESPQHWYFKTLGRLGLS